MSRIIILIFIKNKNRVVIIIILENFCKAYQLISKQWK